LALASVDPASIPVHQLAHRGLRLGPFGSGRDVLKFLCLAMAGATIAAVTTPVVWIPFLAVGGIIAFVRVEGRTLDDYALGYCRFQWRSSMAPRTASTAFPPVPGAAGTTPQSVASIRAGGIPIAYLPPDELQRLFEEWRAALAALDRPVSCRMRGERISPVPFLPVSSKPHATERVARDSYRELVRAVLRQRYRRVVELALANETSDAGREPVLRAEWEELVGTLERLGIPTSMAPAQVRRTEATVGTLP
jgi:hypothetical protein